ncbi:MAG: 30S ribosomal protein S4 [Clostridia bacterium]|jgi:small subunit ribosomal protein S4|nr:30S ribosomal protein S4 [Clostridia bacterium]
MARTIEPDCRQCRREGCKLFLKGERCTTKKCAMERRPVIPGQHGNSKRRVAFSEYGTQLREKQKVKRMYGVLEKQFREYYEKANKMQGVTGENMLSLIERRLDNVVYRMGIGASRKQARQIVNHGLITVNGRRVNIASYQVKAGDTVAIKENKQGNEMFKSLRGSKVVMPKWVEFDTNTFAGKIVALPERADVDADIKEQLIVELYSR